MTPPSFVAIFGAILGLIFGSFLNVVIYRLPRGKSIAYPPSHCPQCGHPLSVWENLPVLSWLALGGKCSACRAPIAARYPLVELMSAALFALAFLERGLTISTLLTCAFAGGLVAVLFIDLDYLLILDAVSGFLATVGLLFALVTHSVLPALEGAAVGIALYGAIYFATRRAGMGLGDVKLAGAIGLFLGLQAAIAALVLAFLIGALLALPVLAAGRRGRRDALPFGPFIVIAAFLLVYSPDAVFGALASYQHFISAHFWQR